ncbi:MAG: sulfatase/phosphatase domain-containing protein, partial [Victivallales bacterium]
DWLKRNNQYENTVFVFTADHGDFAGEHGLFHKNFGIYECLHRIPFIFKMPGGPRGERRRQIIESVDVYPTLCEIAKLPMPDDIDGTSFLSVVNNAGATGKIEALAEYDWFEPGKRINALRTDRHRIVYYDHKHGGELYDHESDPGEIENLWDSPAHQLLKMELLQRLFDRINCYRTPSSVQGDLRTEHEYSYMPTRLVQFGQMDWEILKKTYSTPVPKRGN